MTQASYVMGLRFRPCSGHAKTTLALLLRCLLVDSQTLGSLPKGLTSLFSATSLSIPLDFEGPHGPERPWLWSPDDNSSKFCRTALGLSEIERKKATLHLTQWPPSKLSYSQEVGCFSCCSVHTLCFSFLSLPILSPKYYKTLFQPEVSIRFWHDELMPRFVWPRLEHPSRCFL